MKNKSIISYTILSLAGICAVAAIVFVAGASVAHGCSYYDSYCYDSTPVYSYNSGSIYPYIPAPISPLVATCYPSMNSTSAGNTVQWYTSISGGSTSYNITWSGDEGLYGNGSSISKVYYTAGSKNASINVISGSQTTSVNCSGAVLVSGAYSGVYNNNYNSYSYNQYPYNYNYGTGSYYNYASPLQVTCVANTNYSNIGSTVTWTASVNGGNSYYTYSWSGTDGLYGGNQTLSYAYTYPGTKTASVTVYSNNQSAVGYCSNSVTVGAAYGNYGSNYIATPITSTNSLDIGCYSDPSSIGINQPVTWNAEVSGGVAPYTYSWTGSDGMSGSQSSVIKYYATSGSKSAIVTVTSADGKTGTRACTNSTIVRGAGSGTAVASTRSTSSQQASNQQNAVQQSAASVFSFSNVPWGWIAVLIILVLFGTVMYLLFNRQKI